MVRTIRKRTGVSALSTAFFAFILIAAVSGATAAQSAAAAKRVPTVEDLMALKSAGGARISPDGTRVAYTVTETDMEQDAYVTQIWLADVATGRTLQLTRAKKSSSNPDWSPDGRWIAFDSQHPDGTFDIFVIEAAGGPPRRLTEDPSNEHRPSWSRDGRWIHFASDRTGRFEVWRIPAQGGQAEQVTDQGGFTCHLSPDGRTLYYVKARAAQQPLFARPAEGGPERRVVEEIFGRTFEVDEDGVYYFARTDDPGVTSLRLLEAASGRSREVAHLEALVAPTFGVTVSRDHKTYLFTAYKPDDADLFLIENFR